MQGKLKISAYKTAAYSGEATGSVQVLINPASYTHQHTTSYSKKSVPGAAGAALEFKGISPETISFDIYFDATGTVAPPEEVKVSELPLKKQINAFKNVCFKYNGDIHEPNFLIINWGSLVFKCKLTSLSIEYKLFQKNGVPIRAKASCSFTQALDPNTISKQSNNKSPDLTHLIEIKKGDTLPNICNQIYNDPDYYLQVAKFNKIVNFRNLKPGTKIYLPPLK